MDRFRGVADRPYFVRTVNERSFRLPRAPAAIRRPRRTSPIAIPMRSKPLLYVFWAAVAVLGAVALGTIALHRGETINAAWLVIAAVCTYAVAYRFYARFLATRVFELDDTRATPAERLDNHVDFVPTNRWVLFG